MISDICYSIMGDIKDLQSHLGGSVDDHCTLSELDPLSINNIGIQYPEQIVKMQAFS